MKNAWLSAALASTMLLGSVGASFAQSDGDDQSGGAGTTGSGSSGAITMPEQPTGVLTPGGAAGAQAPLVVSPVVLGLAGAGAIAAVVVLATNHSGHSVTTTTTTSGH